MTSDDGTAARLIGTAKTALPRQPHVHRHRRQGLAHHHHRGAAAAELVHGKSARHAVVPRFLRADYREQHFDCLACNVATQHRAGIDIFVDGDVQLGDDVAGRSWVSYATERIAGIGSPRVEVPPAHFMADKGPGDLMWEVIETRMTPPVEERSATPRSSSIAPTRRLRP